MLYELKEWNENLDLSEFYSIASLKGFVNNSSQKHMIDCFRNEKKWNCWILYSNGIAIGSVAAHTFDDIMGPGSYRILTRVCTFGEYGITRGLIKPKKLISEHQNLTDQFLLPKCIEWAGKDNLYATSNNSEEASQKLVHRYYFPTLQQLGIVEYIKDIFYRNTKQSLWKINADKFQDNLDKFPRWN
jgi:hypothetical protein